MRRPEEEHRAGEQYRLYSASPRKQRSWNAENPGNAAIRRELIESVFTIAGTQLASARHVLDVGCGSGWWLAELSGRQEMSAELHGVDILGERIERARQRIPGAQLSIADARELPYAAGTFDVVTMFTVLSSLAGRDDARRALREAQRALVPGGVLLIWEPRLPNPLNRQTFLITRGLLRAALAGSSIQTRTLTLLPPLARHLGRRTDLFYRRLAQVPLLRTHRLIRATPSPS
jgi:ubiquinone/menaquinone biosynthesis C-methylase UbiE